MKTRTRMFKLIYVKSVSRMQTVETMNFVTAAPIYHTSKLANSKHYLLMHWTTELTLLGMKMQLVNQSSLACNTCNKDNSKNVKKLPRLCKRVPLCMRTTETQPCSSLEAPVWAKSWSVLPILLQMKLRVQQYRLLQFRVQGPASPW